MGKIVYIVGRTVDARQRLLASKIASSKHHSLLHCVPTRGRVIDLEADPRFWPTRKVDTLAGVIHQIFEKDVRFERFKNYRPIDDALRSLLIKKVLEKRGMQPDGLSYFARLFTNRDQEIDVPGIYRIISRFFSLLVRNNFQDIFVQDLARRIIRLEEKRPGMGEERYALESDLTWLFGDYEEIKREIGGFDEDDIIQSVKSHLRDGGLPSLLANTGVLVFDGFIHISKIEEDILSYIFGQVEEVWWLLDYDSGAKDPIGDFKDAAGREATWNSSDKHNRGQNQLGRYEAYRIFTPQVSLMERLEGDGFDYEIEGSIEGPLRNPVAGGLYFHGNMEEVSTDSLRIRSFPNRVDEVRAIAGEIKRIIHEDGLDHLQDLGRIRVIFPDLSDYSSLIFEIFSEYQLPFSLTRGLPLFSHPIATMFLAILEIPLNHFKREGIFRLFSNNLVQGNPNKDLHYNDKDLSFGLREEYLLDGENLSDVEKLMQRGLENGSKATLDIFLFDRVCRRCGLHNLGGDISRLRGKELLWVKDYYQGRYLQAKGTNEKDGIRLEYYQFLVQATLFETILGPFQDLANQRNPQEIVDCFLSILDMLGFPENIVNVPEGIPDLAPETIRVMVKRDMKAYSLLKGLVLMSASEVGIARELFGIREGHELLSRFHDTFRSRLNNAYLLDERNPNIIRISEWLEIRGRSFDYIFAGGLTADRFPFREDVNFILPESPNRMFRILDPIDQSKHLFSHLLRNYQKRLYLSCPRYAEEKEIQLSPILADLETMVRSHLSTQPDASPVLATGVGVSAPIIEEVFRWADNPFFTSEDELLNATIVKTQVPKGMGADYFPLKQLIFKNDVVAERLIRGINSLRTRWASDGLFEYDGLVGGSVEFGEFLKEKGDIFSPSQLEALANCPMRYLFERIYNLEVLEDLGVEVSARDMGEHIHTILKIFFERLKNDRKNVSDIGLNQAFSLARKVAVDYLMKHPFVDKLDFFEYQKREFLAGLDQDWAGSREEPEEREGVFAQLLRFEEREFGDKIPTGLEYGFGHEVGPPVFLGRTRIRGYVDRFDRGRDDNEKVSIYDYKTGRIDSSGTIKQGLSFQLAAYMAALKTGLQVNNISAAFYALKRDSFLKGDPLKNRLREHSEEVSGLDMSGVRLIDDYVDQLMEILDRGYLHHSTDEMICPYCEFKYACYKDMRRMNHILDSGIDRQIYSGRKNLERWEGVDLFRREWKAISQSMEKAFSLKTESGRKGHFERVMRYRDELMKSRDSLPFYDDYIDGLLQRIDDFEKRYISS
jgi:CRISPR/Cas system-associated exonuclease Cas4 (RecB family)